MPGYTVRNLKRDVADAAPGGGLAPGLEARFAHDALESRQAGLSYFKLAPGFRIPFGHRHAQQEEIYLVVSGGARLRLDDEILELGPWDAVRMAPETVRGLEGGPDGAEVLLYGAPRVGANDAELVADWWPKDEEGRA